MNPKVTDFRLVRVQNGWILFPYTDGRVDYVGRDSAWVAATPEKLAEMLTTWAKAQQAAKAKESA